MTIVALGRPELDLAGIRDAIVDCHRAQHGPMSIVSAAAYTAVDKAESEPDLAFAINAAGPELLPRPHSVGVPLVHLSTDYVFDGSKRSALRRRRPTGPARRLWRLQARGRAAVLAAQPNAGPSHRLGLQPVRRQFRQDDAAARRRSRRELRVVADQRGSPTSALDIADGILAIAAQPARGREPAQRGIFHMTGSGRGELGRLRRGDLRGFARRRAGRRHGSRRSPPPTIRRRPGGRPIRGSTRDKLAESTASACPTGVIAADVVTRLVRQAAQGAE